MAETILQSYCLPGVVESQAQNPAFVGNMYALIADAFGRPDFDLEDAQYHLHADYLTVAMTDGKTSGFLSAKFGKPADFLPGIELGEFANQDAAYLFGAAVRQEFQGQGVFKQMAEDFLIEAQHQGFSTVLFSTQNPHLEAGFDRALERRIRTGEVLGATKVRIPVPGRYGRLLTGEMPPAVHVLETQQAYDALRRDQGDAYVVAYQLNYPQQGQ